MMRTSIAALFLLAVSAAAQQPDPEQLVREGVALYDQGQYDAAVGKYRQALALDPKNPNAAYELGLTYAALGKYAECSATLRPLVDIAPAQLKLQTLTMLGNCLDASGDRKRAIETYRTALKFAPDDPRVEYELGISLFADGKLDEARELLKNDVLARPGHANGHFALANVLEAGGFRVPALFEYLRYLALDPTSPRAATAAQHARALLDLGVSRKDEKNITLTVDPNAPKAEGDYGSLGVGLALASGARFTEENAKKSEFERFQEQLDAAIAMFLEMTPAAQNDFTARVNRPFFDELHNAKLLDAYVAVAFSTLQLPGTKEWAAKHQAEVETFIAWMKPRLGEKPAVELPAPR
jgi:tetratricopeptide (TPR) repeat protein